MSDWGEIGFALHLPEKENLFYHASHIHCLIAVLLICNFQCINELVLFRGKSDIAAESSANFSVFYHNENNSLGVSRFKSISCTSTNSLKFPTETQTHSSTSTKGAPTHVVSSLKERAGHPDPKFTKVQDYSHLGISCPISYIPKIDFQMFVDFLEFTVGNNTADTHKGHQRHGRNTPKPTLLKEDFVMSFPQIKGFFFSTLSVTAYASSKSWIKTVWSFWDIASEVQFLDIVTLVLLAFHCATNLGEKSGCFSYQDTTVTTSTITHGAFVPERTEKDMNRLAKSYLPSLGNASPA